MAERLVDVLDSNGLVIHTYPIILGELGNAANESEYLAKALEAAASGRLVPDSDLVSLTARMHIARSGQMAAYGDDIDCDSETKVALEQEVRKRAYFLWKDEGCPVGSALEHWHRALEQHLQERAYVLWQQEGSPVGRADEYWRRTQEFEAQ